MYSRAVRSSYGQASAAVSPSLTRHRHHAVCSLCQACSCKLHHPARPCAGRLSRPRCLADGAVEQHGVECAGVPGS